MLETIPGQARPRASARLKRRATRWVCILIGLYAAWVATLYVVQDRLVYQPRAAGPAKASLPPAEGDVHWIDIENGGRVEAWFVRGAGRSATSPGPLVILLHGNGEIIEQCLPLARMYAGRGLSVLLPEYRGYGRSSGSPEQDAIVSDMLRFRELAAARPEVDPARIILHGRSLGGGVAAAVAAQREPAALVLESTFTSVAGFAAGLGVPAFLCTNPYRTDRAVAALRCPILILHGADDGLIPPSHGRALHRLAPGSRYAELAGGHNDFPRDPDEYERVLLDFLDAHGLRPAWRPRGRSGGHRRAMHDDHG
jgi:fermentation-respiration switch protein FrsA (DUF1100 family)